ncbi:hypothetical protein ABIB62_002243 [Mucilaginibacter sp. UYP25]
MFQTSLKGLLKRCLMKVVAGRKFSSYYASNISTTVAFASNFELLAILKLTLSVCCIL